MYLLFLFIYFYIINHFFLIIFHMVIIRCSERAEDAPEASTAPDLRYVVPALAPVLFF